MLSLQWRTPSLGNDKGLCQAWATVPWGSVWGCVLALMRIWVSRVAQTVKNLPVMLETWVWSLGGEDPLEKGMATHSSILAWRIPCSNRLGCKELDITDQLTHTHTHTRSLSLLLRLTFTFGILECYYSWNISKETAPGCTLLLWHWLELFSLLGCYCNQMTASTHHCLPTKGKGDEKRKESSWCFHPSSTPSAFQFTSGFTAFAAFV